MGRIINSAFIVLCLFISGCDTSGNVDPVFNKTFLKYYGSEGDQYASDLLVDDEDGSMLILGNSVSLSGQKTAFIIKTDHEGNVQWESNLGEVNDTAVDIELIENGQGQNQFIIAMNAESQDSTNIKLLKIDSDGTVVETKLLRLHPGGRHQIAKSITVLQQSNEYVVTGWADRSLVKETSPVAEADQSDILALRVSGDFSSIDTVVSKGGEMNGSGIKIFELDEIVGQNAGKLVLFSSTDRPFESDAFGYNFSFDIVSAGTPVGKLIGTEADQEILASVVKVPFLRGGGFLMAGTARSSLDGPGDLYLVKYDEELQQKAVDVRLQLGKNLECVSAHDASSGYYLLSNERAEGSFRDISLVKVSRFGEFEWSRSFGTREGDDNAAAVVVLPDGRIAIVATMELQTKRKIALIVVNGNGNF